MVRANRQFAAGGSADPGSAPGPREDGIWARSPVIVLGYPYCGAARLRQLLSGHTALACTSGTGLLPLCEVAAATWRQVEGRQGALSPLAAASIRALTGSLITTALAGTGKLRWCEVAFARPSSAEVFLQVYPSARFICMHRQWLDVVREAIQANPWGLADSPFQSFAYGYPGNSVAAVAAHWAASTEPLLEFERAHLRACYRVRHDDLVSRPAQVLDEVCAFLALDRPEQATAPWSDDAASPVAVETEASPAGPIPLERIPPPLMSVLDRLMAAIGYPPSDGSRSPDVSSPRLQAPSGT